MASLGRGPDTGRGRDAREEERLGERVDLEDLGAAVGAPPRDGRTAILHRDLLRILDLDLLAFLDAVALRHRGPPFEPIPRVKLEQQADARGQLVRNASSYLRWGVVVVVPGVSAAPAPPAAAPLPSAPAAAWLCRVEMFAEFCDCCFCSEEIDCWSWLTEAFRAAW